MIIQQGLKRLKTLDTEQILSSTLSFTAAHLGCVAAPVLSTAVLGTSSPLAGVVGTLTFGVAATFGADAWIQKVKPDTCLRCVKSRMDGFKRQGRLLGQTLGIGLLVHTYHVNSGLHEHHLQEHDPSGIPICRTIPEDSVVNKVSFKSAQAVTP